MVIPRRLLEAARDASDIIALAKRQAADERQRGFQEGFVEGLKAGRERLIEIDGAIDAYWSEREEELITVALALAHRVIADLPEREHLVGLIRTALTAHRGETMLELAADPATALALHPLLPDFLARSPITVRADPSLSPGMILLSHRDGQTQLGLVQQFRALLASVDA